MTTTQKRRTPRSPKNPNEGQPQEPEAPKKRLVNLTRRQADVSNVNLSPEKAGDDLVQRADLSLTFLLEQNELAELIITRDDPVGLFWDKDGEPQIDLAKAFPVRLVAEGKLDLGILGESKMITFKTGTLKKVAFEPLLGKRARVACQVRIDPTGHLEALGRMRVEQKCKLAFTGSVVKEKDEDDGDEGGKQQELV